MVKKSAEKKEEVKQDNKIEIITGNEKIIMIQLLSAINGQLTKVISLLEEKK